MKNCFLNQKVQMAFFPIAFLCILIVWLAAEQGIQSVWTTLLLAVGLLFFILDRIFKPWKLRRLEKQMKEQE